jgi:catechol-2,3-dioxygenase
MSAHICQVAFSCHSGGALRQWYADVFGLVKSGRILFFPPSTSNVQGIPGAWEKCSWLIDQQNYFQLEFFQFFKPRSQLKRRQWRPCDVGYNVLGMAVNDFDQVIRNACARSGINSPPVFGDHGERRTCLTDPEGNFVEVFERDPLSALAIPHASGAAAGKKGELRPEVPAVVRVVRISVPDIDVARHSYEQALGLKVLDDIQLHSPEHEAMWGLAGAMTSSLVLCADNFLIELVQYHTPSPADWPECYSIADQGIMNIALGYSKRSEYDHAFQRATQNGMTANGKVTDIGVFRVMYVNDPRRFSVEMLYARRRFWWLSGFSATEPYVENEIHIEAPAAVVWRYLTDHAGAGEWTPFRGRVLREGSVDPNGLGCLRELSAFGARLTEEVTAWSEGYHYAYQLRTGAPFRRHQGDIFLFEENGGTRVRWAIRFESWIPFAGRPLALLMRLLFGHALRNLKTLLEQPRIH